MLALVALRRRIDWERGRLLREMKAGALFLDIGYASWDRYVEHALGMSDADVKQLLELEPRLEHLPRTAEALRTGELSRRVITMLLRVARPQTDAAWVEHARQATCKRLEVEIPHHVWRRSCLGEAQYLVLTEGKPIADMPVRPMLPNWRKAFGVEIATLATREGGANRAVEQVAAGPLPPFMRMRVTVLAPRDVAEHFEGVVQRVRGLVGLAASTGACVAWMLRRFAAVHWNAEIEKLMRRYVVLERAGWLCSSPHCRARSGFEDHHVEYRSRGGSNALSNRVPACWWCHHRLIHGGKMTVMGEAPDGLLHQVGAGGWRRVYRNEMRIPIPMH